MKAMILAAGKGTRLQPLTNTLPKALINIGGISMLEHQINYLRYYGVTEIIINVHHFAELIEDFIKRKKYNFRIEFSYERSFPLETGGGLKKASWFFDDGNPFFLIGTDIYTNLNLLELLDFHINNNALATLGVKKRDTSRELLIDEDNYLCGWRNNITSEIINSRKTKKNIDNYGFSVVHVIDPKMFELMSEEGSFSLTPFYLRIAGEFPVKAFVQKNDEWLEFGRIENLSDASMIKRAEIIINKYLPPEH